MNKKSLLRQLQNYFMKKARKKSPLLVILVLISFGLAFYLLTEYEANRPSVGKESPSYENIERPEKEKIVIEANNADDFLNLKWDGSIANIAVPINNNKATFTEADLEEDGQKEFWVKLSQRDKLGRAQVANAKLDRQTYLEIKAIRRPRIPQGNDPVGWRYKGRSNNETIYFEGESQALYNRSHLLAWMLVGDAGSMENLVTGARAFNSPGMNKYERKVSDALYYNKLPIRYRVTPIYKDNELLPRGVQMMAKSIGDNGKSIDMNVYVFNVQPGVQINYLTGENSLQK